jgi:hypothetical protein
VEQERQFTGFPFAGTTQAMAVDNIGGTDGGTSKENL